MPRRPKPWYKASHRAWYVKFRGKMVRLADNEKDAWKEFYALMASDPPAAAALPPAGGRPLVADMIDAWYVVRSQEKLSADTKRVYAIYGQSFISFLPSGTKAPDVRPVTIRAWLDSHPRWGVATRRLAITAIKGAFRWGTAEGWIEKNPIAAVKTPDMPSREPAERKDVDALLAAVPPAALEILAFMIETGVRPGEAVGVSAAAVDFKAGTARVVGKMGARLVVIPSRYIPVLRGIAMLRPDGPLFLDPTGAPWTPKTLSRCVRNTRARIGMKGVVVPYHLRGIFATDRIAAGVDHSIVGKMLGHSTPLILHKHYHNPELDTLREAADRPAKGKKKARPKPGE